MKRISLVIAIFLLTLGFSAQSKTIGKIFEDTVLVTLSSGEMDSLKAFIGQSLTEVGDSEKVIWRSEESKTVGLFKSVISYDYSGKTCRRALIGLKNEAGKKDFWRFDFCNNNGKWQYTPTPAVNLSNADRDALLEKARFMLAHGATKKPVSWQSQNRNLAGALVLLDEADTCREIALSLIDRAGAEISGVYRFCLENDEWAYSGPAL